MPRTAPATLKPTMRAVREREVGFAVEGFDELQLAEPPRVASCRARCALPDSHSISAASFRNGSAERPSSPKLAPMAGGLAGGVDVEEALALAVVQLDVVERRLQHLVLQRDGQRRLADLDVLEHQPADAQLGVRIGDAEQRQIDRRVRPAGALRVAVHLGSRCRLVDQVLDGARLRSRCRSFAAGLAGAAAFSAGAPRADPLPLPRYLLRFSSEIWRFAAT